MNSGGTLETLKVVVEGETSDFRNEMKQIKTDMQAANKEIKETLNGIKQMIDSITKEIKSYGSESKKTQDEVTSSLEKQLEPVKKVKEGIQNMNSEMRETAKIGQLYIDGSSYKQISKEADVAETKVKKLESALRELESSGGDIQYTQEYKDIASAIDQAEKKLRTLEDRQIKMDALGVDKNSKSWKSLQYDIDETGNSLRAMKIDMENLPSSDRFTNTEKWKKLIKELEETRIKLAQASAAKQRFENTGAGNSSVSRSLLGTTKGMNNATSSIKRTSGAFASLIQRFKNGIPWFGKGGGSADNFAGKMKGLSGAMNTLGITARFMFASFVLMGTVNGAKEGLQNLAQYSDKTNQSISTLYSGVITLKNAFAVAFAPILNVIVPYLNTFINYLVGASNAIAQLLSALTGSSTWVKATRVQADYAASLDKTSGSANSAKKAILGFDEINALSNNSSGGSGSAGSPSVGDMFSTENVSGQAKNWADAIKTAWDNADFTAIGKTVGDKIAAALEGINWDSYKNTSGKIGKSAATFLNGTFESKDLYYQIGRTAAEGINTVFTGANSFVTYLKWDGLGKSVGKSINGFFDNWDAKLTGDTFSKAVIGIQTAIKNGLEEVKWESVGKKIYDLISSIKWNEIFKNGIDVGKVTLKATFDLAIGAASGISWDFTDWLADKTGSLKFSESQKSTITEQFRKDFQDMFDKFNLFDFTAKAISDALSGQIINQEAYANVKSKIEDFGTSVSGWIKEFTNPPSPSMTDVWLEDNFGTSSEKVRTTIQTWWNADVKPMFTKEIWSSNIGSTKEAFAEKWTEFTTWWNNTSVPEFWNKYVLPIFTTEGFKKRLGSIKDAFEDKWKDFTSWWENTALVKFWNGVESNLSSKSWKSKIGSIKDAMEEKWNDFKRWWGNLTIGFPKIKIPNFSWSGLFDAATGAIGKIMVSGYSEFASGGFPSPGQMFLANENGPELVGKMGNKTTVANQDQIAEGFADAIYPAMYNAVANAMSGNSGGTAPVIEFTFMVDSETLYQMNKKGEQSYNRRYKVVTNMT